jgi:hypothetical protein
MSDHRSLSDEQLEQQLEMSAWALHAAHDIKQKAEDAYGPLARESCRRALTAGFPEAAYAMFSAALSENGRALRFDGLYNADDEFITNTIDHAVERHQLEADITAAHDGLSEFRVDLR